MSNRGLLLNKLILISENRVRLAIAKNGYKLNILKYNKNPRIRLEVAKHGACLDELIKDEYWEVRAEVARQGYGLDILAYDNDARVRVVAERLPIENIKDMINDKSSKVRAKLIKRGVLPYDENGNIIFGKTFNEQRELIKLGYIPETTELHLSNSKKEKIAWKIFAKNFGENLITTCSKELDYLNLSEFNKKRLFDKFQAFIKKEKIKEQTQLNMIKNRKMILHRETERNL